MKWITRERPKIDRIACPWLIQRFVDPAAEFIYVPFDQVIGKSKELDAIPFDLPEVEYTHYGDECTFDYIIKKHKLMDSALKIVATIVRGADTDGTTSLRNHPAYGRSRQVCLKISGTIRSFLARV